MVSVDTNTYHSTLTTPMFEILHDDEHLIAINKPPGMLVHRSRLSEDRVFVLQLLRDQIGQRLYPAHRLDRATSGVLVFGKDPASAAALGAQFMDKSLEKKYLAVVRGFVPEQDVIDYPLADEETDMAAEAAAKLTEESAGRAS